jgi:hypothetical protein
MIESAIMISLIKDTHFTVRMIFVTDFVASKSKIQYFKVTFTNLTWKLESLLCDLTLKTL